MGKTTRLFLKVVIYIFHLYFLSLTFCEPEQTLKKKKAA
jgi:hypothetical protein